MSLEQLGWRPRFRNQIAPDEADRVQPARVMEIHRTGLTLGFADDEREVPLGGRWYRLDVEQRPTVGDWVLVDGDAIERVLDRSSVIKRRSAGGTGEVQLIAANIDTMFIVSSCNNDFSPSRIERYLAVAFDATVQPVIVLTKADLVDDAGPYRDDLRALRSGLVIETVDATDPATLSGVRGWCCAGETIALLGSSGVGKSTLLNTLSGANVQAVGGIREDDGKGRHTTTHRSLHLLEDGGLVLDSPGMRELGLVDAERGVEQLFEDIDALAAGCRFGDCAHEREPGCAVRKALEDGRLEARRLESYRKLQREESRNTETAAQRHARARSFGKLTRGSMARKQSQREDPL
jgi:ribosome biogenesis GTPase